MSIQTQLDELADKQILAVILQHLNNEDTLAYCNYLLEGKYEDAEGLVDKKIPDLEKKVMDGLLQTMVKP